ncbi:hypothetical protein VTH06DRAFT_7869 [Thermothelomyces fergusii]
MSTYSQAPRIDLDARAAELKEKLLRSRSQIQSQAPPVSLPADANDIADLISSISASVSRSSETARSHIKEQYKTESVAPPSDILSKEKRLQDESPVPTPTSVTTQNITPAPEVFPAPTSLSAGQPVEPKSVQAREGNSQSAATDAQLPPRRPTNEPIGQGEACPQTSAQKFSGESRTETNRNNELRSEQAQLTPTKPPTHISLNGEVKSRSDAPMHNLSAEYQSMESETNDDRPGHSEAEASDEVFARLLNQLPDLRDFLEMTDYYNVEARTRRLSRFRRAKALAAEKRRIEEEERKLREEEELEMRLQGPTVARLTSVIPSALSVSDSNTIPTPVTPSMKSINGGEGGETPRAVPVKRELELDSHEARQDKVPRLEGPPPSARYRDLDDKPQKDMNREERCSRRELSPPREDRHRQSPLSRPPCRDGNRSEDSRREDRYKGEDNRYREPERRPSYPIHVDLGGKGDTRFFLLKSFNDDNVRRCMEENLWTTQIPNAEILAKAFAGCKNVILFFSVNKSKAFQGYARMVSPPSPDNPRPSFIKTIHWETSDPFRVQWLSKTTVEFWRIGDIKNPYNDNQPVLVGKDGQEIEAECGRALLREMENCALAAEAGNRMVEDSRRYGGPTRPPVERYHVGRRDSGGGRFSWDRYRGY